MTPAELSLLLKFYTHPWAPRRHAPRHPPRPHNYVPRYSTELSPNELSTLLKLYTYPGAPRRCAPEPSQPYIYAPRYSPEYTDSEQSALWAFLPRPRYSVSEQSALDAFSGNLFFAWLRSFRTPTPQPPAPAESPAFQPPDLQPPAPKPKLVTPIMVPDQTQPAFTMPPEAMNPEMGPHPGTAPEATQELGTTPATAAIDPDEINQSVGPSQLDLATADPQPSAQQPFEHTSGIPPQENIPVPPTNDDVICSAPTNALFAPPPAPVPDLTPPTIDDDEDDDNNLIGAHRRARAKKAILKDGPMKWMPDDVIYGLKEALDDLAEANKKAKKRLLSRKNPISTSAIVRFDTDFGGFMPGDWKTRPEAKRNWINQHMLDVLDKACGRPPRSKTPAAPSGDKQGKPAAAGKNDGAADTPKDDAADVGDDLLPPGWAVGDDEDDDGGPNLNTGAAPADTPPADDATAGGLDCMMNGMNIGQRISKFGHGLPPPRPTARVM